MKWVGGILLLMLFGVSTKAQNLVPNPSFEEYDVCPDGLNDFNGYVSGWFKASPSSTDYYHACAGSVGEAGVPQNFPGYQVPRTGEAYAGILCYTDGGTREYVEIGLTQPLQADTAYCAEFYAVRCNYYGSVVSSLGICFTTDTAYEITIDAISYVPQITNPLTDFITDTLNWTRVSGQFIAQGGERFVTIGNFLPNEESPVVTGPPNNSAY
ncbi:MAG TPA: hypothetical protein VEY71_00750, partial [Chitinophagales bacterium]|nr:hypothetical protein [Chitinophagales bacterium]